MRNFTVIHPNNHTKVYQALDRGGGSDGGVGGGRALENLPSTDTGQERKQMKRLLLENRKVFEINT